MIIKILGPGCTNCVNLERATREALDQLGLDATVEKVTDYAAIVGYGVMSTPGLVVDEQVVLSGRVPKTGGDQAAPHRRDNAMSRGVPTEGVPPPWHTHDVSRAGGVDDERGGDHGAVGRAGTGPTAGRCRRSRNGRGG